jgi:phosphoserine phosphatase
VAVVAVIFDFDDTLAPDSTSALLTAHGIDAADFWANQARALVDQGYDPPLAYLNLLLNEVGPRGRLGELNNARLRTFGAELDGTWFPGLPDLFDDLRGVTAEYRDITAEFYIISGGLQALVEGSAHVQKHFRAVYGCQFGEDPDTGLISSVRRAVTFTEKTRFLFEINKGVAAAEAATRPHLVNEYVDEARRPVPFRNMIYVGDGLTDVPCFSLVDKGGGTTFGVFKRTAASARQAFQQFLATKRVHSLYSPDYREDADLGAMLRAAVAAKCMSISIDAKKPLTD